MIFEVAGASVLLALLGTEGPGPSPAQRALKDVLRISRTARARPYQFSVIFRINRALFEEAGGISGDLEQNAYRVLRLFDFEELGARYKLIGVTIDRFDGAEVAWLGLEIEMDIDPDLASEQLPERLRKELEPVPTFVSPEFTLLDIVTVQIERTAMPLGWWDEDADFWVLGGEGPGYLADPGLDEEEQRAYGASLLLGLPEIGKMEAYQYRWMRIAREGQ